MIKKFIELVTKNPWLATIITGTIIPGIIAALTATNEMYHAVQTKSDWGKSSQAYEQKALWIKNITCMKDNEFTYITNDHNVEVGSIVCPTGDVLISAKRPENKNPSFKLVSLDNISKPIAFNSFSIISEAQAGEECQAFNNENYLIQESYSKSGYCTRYYLDPHYGSVVCSEPCE